jgi:AbrB family looped-hinge helix DNA binding protein
MNLVTKVGKEGVVPIPEGIRKEIRLKEGDLLFVNANPDGSITLHPAPREYTEEDLRMFAEEDEMTPAERERFLAWLGREPRLFGR